MEICKTVASIGFITAAEANHRHQTAPPLSYANEPAPISENRQSGAKFESPIMQIVARLAEQMFLFFRFCLLIDWCEF